MSALSTWVNCHQELLLAALFMANRTSDLHAFLSCGFNDNRFHCFRSRSVSSCQDIFGHPGPRLPSTDKSRALLIAPLDRSTWHYHRSRCSLNTRSRSCNPTFSSRSQERTLDTSSGFTCHSCLIMALSFLCRRNRLGLVRGQVSLAWSKPLCTRAVDAATCLR